MATLKNETIKKIILKLLNGDDYRIEIVELLNSTFLQYALDFFKRVIDAKLNSDNINIDWYKKGIPKRKLIIRRNCHSFRVE